MKKGRQGEGTMCPLPVYTFLHMALFYQNNDLEILKCFLIAKCTGLIFDEYIFSHIEQNKWYFDHFRHK